MARAAKKKAKKKVRPASEIRKQAAAEKRRIDTARLYFGEGQTQVQIAKQLGVSQPTISLDISILRDLWAARSYDIIAPATRRMVWELREQLTQIREQRTFLLGEILKRKQTIAEQKVINAAGEQVGNRDVMARAESQVAAISAQILMTHEKELRVQERLAKIFALDGAMEVKPAADVPGADATSDMIITIKAKEVA